MKRIIDKKSITVAPRKLVVTYPLTTFPEVSIFNKDKVVISKTLVVLKFV